MQGAHCRDLGGRGPRGEKEHQGVEAAGAKALSLNLVPGSKPEGRASRVC